MGKGRHPGQTLTLNFKQKIAVICRRYDIADMYVFGSRSKEVAGLIENETPMSSDVASDVDIGILPAKREAWDPEKRVQITIELEDLFQISRVDLVLLLDADPYLALDVIRGELLYTNDLDRQARDELLVLRRAGDLLPLKKERTRMILEDGAR